MSNARAFERALARYRFASEALDRAALKELRKVVADCFEGATGFRTHGEYTDNGDLRLEIDQVTLGNGKTLSEENADVEEWELLGESAGEFLRWLVVVGDESYLHELDWTMEELDATTCECEDLGYLLEQEYGYAEIPEGWTPVQSCDLCQRFDDEEAANAAAQQIVAEGLAPNVVVKWFPGVAPEDDDSGEEYPGDWAIGVEEG